jgi:hypothetical protein
MPNIVHRIGTEKATADQVYSSISTIAGLTSWWTPKVSGDSKIGGILQFLFSKGGPEFEVIDLQPQKRVEWRCVKGPSDWMDTHIEFMISKNDQETILLFKHSGWREEVEFMYHCSTQWAYFLIGLRKFLETGKGTPYGDGQEHVSLWSR